MILKNVTLIFFYKAEIRLDTSGKSEGASEPRGRVERVDVGFLIGNVTHEFRHTAKSWEQQGQMSQPVSAKRNPMASSTSRALSYSLMRRTQKREQALLWPSSSLTQGNIGAEEIEIS
jgi:hypothetical protein